MSRITARCHPKLRAMLPPPVPAQKLLPGWLRTMPEEVAADSLAGAPVRTLKHCPPLIDALRLGIIIPSAADITVTAGEIAWDWDPPSLAETHISRAPVGIHIPEQAEGSAFDPGGALVLKFVNFWTLEAEPGWSLLFHHPAGYPDLPFRTLGGVVDCDLFKDGYVHFPTLLDPDFEGVIPRGTPVAQVVPVQRNVALELAEMDAEEIERNADLQVALGKEGGVYRKSYRR
ncbi:MAG: hypothetical protein AAFY59_03425 [Pseudomonadota bacterium]